MSIVAYSVRTTGTNASFDQILQFAAVHTDEDLNELERLDVQCRLQPYLIPKPEMVLQTRTSVEQLTDPALFSVYEATCAIRRKLDSWSPATFVGYDSYRFGEHFLRQAFYKALHPPYLTNTNGNTRADAMRMVQAAAVFSATEIVVPTGRSGQLLFGLRDVVRANGIENENEGTALADVRATLDVCRVLSKRTPELWSSSMRFSQKAAVIDFIGTEPAFLLGAVYSGRPYSWVVTALGANTRNGSEYYVYDLSIDPEELVGMPEEVLASRLQRRPRPVRRLRMLPEISLLSPGISVILRSCGATWSWKPRLLRSTAR